MGKSVQIRNNLQELYKDVYTAEALSAISALERFNTDIKELMALRTERRLERQETKKRIEFLDPSSLIPGTTIRVQDARDGNFEGAVIPAVFSVNGSRARALPPNRALRWKAASAMSRMLCCPAPMAGCSMGKMLLDRRALCPWTTSAI